MFRALRISRNQRVVHLVDGKFHQLFGPGLHSVWTWTGMHDFHTLAIQPLPQLIPEDDLVPPETPGTHILQVAPHERVAILIDGIYRQLLGPGRYRWWDEAGKLTELRFDMRQPPRAVQAEDPLPLTATGFYNTVLFAESVLVSRDGRPSHTSPPGRYRLWEGAGWSIVGVTRQFRNISNEPFLADHEDAITVTLAQNERAIVYLEGVFLQLLPPGRHLWWKAAGPVEIQRFDITAEPAPLADNDPAPQVAAGFYTTSVFSEPAVLIRDARALRVTGPGRYRLWAGGPWNIGALPRTPVDATSDPFYDPEGTERIEVAIHERVVAFRDGVLVGVLNPGRHAWWKAAGTLATTRFDIRDEPQPLPATDALPAIHPAYIMGASVENQALVLLKDGLPVSVLPTGRYRAWVGSRWTFKVVPLSLQSLDVAPQDILTKDQIPVRIKPAVSVRVVDPIKTLLEPDWTNQVYTAAQLAVREVVSTRELDALLVDRDALGKELRERASALLPNIGMALETVSVKDIILPGEIKDLLNRVTLAKKEAEALAIKRREETASTRQLANTARLLENNPVLLRLKELESLNELASRIDKITLVGGGELIKNVMLSELKNNTSES